MSSGWNNEMLEGFQRIIKIDKDIQSIYNTLGFPQNRSVDEGFKSLVRIIIGQQISTFAAQKVYDNFKSKDLLNEKNLSQMSIEDLKLLGLSNQKSNYIKNLAILLNTQKLNLNGLRYMDGASVNDILTQVKGIGKWTANNYRLFALQDVDAWPSADLALQESVKIIKKLPSRPKEEDMEKIVGKWKPYRGAAAIFLWQYYNYIKKTHI